MFYKINPSVKEYIWAGKKLKSRYNKETDLEKISETWEFSINDSGLSTIEVDGVTVTLKDYMKTHYIGKNLKDSEPMVLIKLIDSDDNLSIQVHPSDEYALVNYSKLGKTEMWYIVDNEPGAYLYLGFNDNYSKEEVEVALNNGTIISMLNKVEVKPGDFFSIPSGTIHAIGKGITLYEIQENSDLTFRLYDYDRVDKNGMKRELHIEQALNVLKYEKYDLSQNKTSEKQRILCANKYFELERFNLYNQYTLKITDGSYAAVTVIKGRLTIDGVDAKMGDTFYFDPNTFAKIEGKAELLIARSADFGVGLDVGGQSVKGLIIDDNGMKLAETKVPTESDKGLDTIISNMYKAYVNLLNQSGLPKNYFTKIGIGFPGNVDSNKGIVALSNNLGLRNANIKEEFEKISGLETIVDNDANCAALGEYYYTDKKKYHDMTMITLGTGVGSGIIINSKLFKGGMGSMTELGHMKVKSDPVKCTCGQYGCFEAIMSLQRLKDDVEKLRQDESTGLKELIADNEPALKIFELDEVNEAAAKFAKKYQANLLLGLTNICNIFQPQIIAVGGGVSYVVSKYFPSIEKKMNLYKFSGFDAPKVKLVQATLGNDAGAYGAVALTKVE